MCNGRHRLQVIIDFFQANMPIQHSPGKWDRKYESLQIRESHTRLCMRLVLMYARQPRPGPRPNRPSNGLLQGTAAIFLMYRYTTCFYVFSKNPKCHHYTKHHQHEHSNIPKYQTYAKKTNHVSSPCPSLRVCCTKARIFFPETFAQHK